MHWQVGIRIPGLSPSELGDIEVRLNGEPLSLADTPHFRGWPLPALDGHVELHVAGVDGPERRVTIPQPGPLVFRLVAGNHGRLVRSIGDRRGQYLAIVPESWQPIAGALPGFNPLPAMVEPDTHLAYHIEGDLDDVAAVEFLDNIDSVHSIPVGQGGFTLEGKVVPDAADGPGPLFVGQPPNLVLQPGLDWSDIQMIVIGEEGPGNGRWSMPIEPRPSLFGQPLNHWIGDRGSGWYFVRLYDHDDMLIDSLDFRFLRSLREVRIRNVAARPPENGHPSAYIEFYYQSGALDLKCVSHDQLNRRMIAGQEKTLVEVDPNADFDRTSWKIRDNSSRPVAIEILLERLWWKIESENSEPAAWESATVELRANEVTVDTQLALWIRFPRAGWCHRVDVIPGSASERRYRVTGAQRSIAIPLREFIDLLPPDGLRDPMSFRVRVYRRDEAIEIWPLKLVPTLMCHLCNWCDHGGRSDLLAHLEANHIDELFRQLSYRELSERFGDLPPYIYRCKWCDHIEVHHAVENATSRINEHLDKCWRADRGQPEWRAYRWITDVDEIRSLLKRDIPDIWRCRRCDADLSAQDRAEHLRNCPRPNW